MTNVNFSEGLTKRVQELAVESASWQTKRYSFTRRVKLADANPTFIHAYYVENVEALSAEPEKLAALIRYEKNKRSDRDTPVPANICDVEITGLVSASYDDANRADKLDILFPIVSKLFDTVCDVARAIQPAEPKEKANGKKSETKKAK